MLDLVVQKVTASGDYLQHKGATLHSVPMISQAYPHLAEQSDGHSVQVNMNYLHASGPHAILQGQ